MVFSLSTIKYRPWSILTAVFLHGSITHLLYNMYSLFIFGNIVEIHTSRKNYLSLIFASAIFANLAFGLINPNSGVVGLSGVVYALIGAAMVRFPNLRVPLPIGPIALPVKIYFAGPVMAIGEALVSFIANDNIAHLAHFAGFLVGVFFAKFSSSWKTL